MTGNGSGRAAVWYGDSDSVINGVRTTDDPIGRPDNFNCRLWVKTPFGLYCPSGIMNCRRDND